MKNRRDFLKFLGIGAAAVGTAVLATRGGDSGSPAPAPEPMLYESIDQGRDWIEDPEGKILSDTDDPRFKELVDATKAHLGPQMVDHVFMESPLLQFLKTDRKVVKIPEGDNRIRAPFTYKGREWSSEFECWKEIWGEEEAALDRSRWDTPEMKSWGRNE